MVQIEKKSSVMVICCRAYYMAFYLVPLFAKYEFYPPPPKKWIHSVEHNSQFSDRGAVCSISASNQFVSRKLFLANI